MTDYESEPDKPIVVDAPTESEHLSEEVVFEKPFKKLLIILALALSTIVVLLFITGMILGFTGRKPPNFEIESFTKPDGKEQVETVTTTTINKTSEVPSDKSAFDDGKAAGEKLKSHKDAEDDFWAGFNEGLNKK